MASLATPATSSKQAACNHPLQLLMRNFVRGDNYINDQLSNGDISMLSLCDATLDAMSECAVVKV